MKKIRILSATGKRELPPVAMAVRAAKIKVRVDSGEVQDLDPESSGFFPLEH